MKERYRKIKALIALVRFSSKMPAWVTSVLADSIRRAGGSENFQHEIVKLQQKAYEIQKELKQ
jgi:hypothetical protein